MHNLPGIGILPQLLKLYLQSAEKAQHMYYCVTGCLECAGLGGAHFTYTIRQQQLLQRTLHLLFVCLKLKLCSDQHCRLEASASVLMTFGANCCQV